MSETKKCPYCAEEIKVEAIVCKHCGRELPEYHAKAPEFQSNKVSRSITKKNNHWRIGRRVGVFVAALTFVVIPLVRLSEIGNVSNPLAVRALLFDALLGTIMGVILNFLVTTIFVAAMIYLWRSQRSVLYTLLGVGVVIFMIQQFRNGAMFAGEVPPTVTSIIRLTDPPTIRPTATSSFFELPDWAPEGALKYTVAILHEGEENWYCGEIKRVYIDEWDFGSSNGEPRVVITFIDEVPYLSKSVSVRIWTNQYESTIGFWAGLRLHDICVYGTPKRVGFPYPDQPELVFPDVLVIDPAEVIYEE